MRQLTTCLVALTALAACGEEPPSPTEVRSAINSDLSRVLTEAKAASDGTANKLPQTTLFQSFFANEAPTLPPRFQNLADKIDANRIVMRAAGDGNEEEAFDPDELTKFLEEKVFTDANHLGDGIYKIPASLVCVTDAPTTSQPTVDPVCAADFEKMQLRVRVANDDDALVFFVQVDANHDEPLSVSLSHDRLAVSIDLDEASDAAIALGEATTSAKLSGAITGSLTILGAKHAKVAVDIDRAVSVQLDELKFATAASQLLALELDGNTSKAALSVGLGETTAHIPGDEFEPQARDYDLAGLSVDASFDGTTIALNNISLGNKTSTVKVNGETALSVDLNKNDGRKLDATLADNMLTVSPRLDVEIQQNHELLDEERPTFDITRVFLDGALRGDDEAGAVKVVRGTFAISTDPAQYSFSATAGQCVASAEDGFSVYTCQAASESSLIDAAHAETVRNINAELQRKSSHVDAAHLEQLLDLAGRK